MSPLLALHIDHGPGREYSGSECIFPTCWGCPGKFSWSSRHGGSERGGLVIGVGWSWAQNATTAVRPCRGCAWKWPRRGSSRRWKGRARLDLDAVSRMTLAEKIGNLGTAAPAIPSHFRNRNKNQDVEFGIMSGSQAIPGLLEKINSSDKDFRMVLLYFSPLWHNVVSCCIPTIAPLSSTSPKSR